MGYCMVSSCNGKVIVKYNGIKPDISESVQIDIGGRICKWDGTEPTIGYRIPENNIRSLLYDEILIKLM